MNMRSLHLTLLLFCFKLSISQDVSFFNSPYVDHYSNVIPQTPNAANFANYGNIPVDYSTGIPNISIPLYTLVVDGVQVPISISYHSSGVKVDELASVVGLKWTLNAGGGVFRSIAGGKADEQGWLDPLTSFLEDSWYTTHPISSSSTQDDLKGNDHDHDPDSFNFSFLGNSGQFIFNPKTGLTNPSIMKERLDKLSLIPQFNVALKKLNAFIAKDYSGNVFNFGTQELNENTSITARSGSLPTGNHALAYQPTGWMLDKITTKNNKLINFGYVPYQFTYQLPISQRITVNPTGNPSNCWEVGPGDNTFLELTTVIYKPKNQLIDHIDSENTKIEFVYSEDATLSDWKKQLDKIIIKDLIANKQKEFHFVYGKFSGDPRLQLKEVYEVGFDGQRKPSYIFTYNQVYPLPAKGSFAKDHWGYYNGQNNQLLVPYTTPGNINISEPYKSQLANREVFTSFVETGVMTKIQYPTGGTTEFTYESNTTTTVKQGGLRVKEIKDTDGEQKTYNHTYYTYEGYHGLVWEEYLSARAFGSSYVYSSDYIITDPSLSMQGFYYEKVTVKQKFATNEFITSEHYFTDNSTLQSYSSLPEEILSFKDTDTILKKTFAYSKNIETTLYWNQLGDLDYCYVHLAQNKIGYNVPTNTYFRTYKHLLTSESTTNYNSLATNEYVPSSVIKLYNYNSNLLITSEIIDGRFKVDNGKTDPDNYDLNGFLYYVANTYPSNYPTDTSLQNLISTKNLISLPVSKTISTNGVQTQGEFFTYDLLGNVKESYHYNKGMGSNNSTTNYIPSTYDLVNTYSHINGNPTEVNRNNGSPIAYIWGYKESLPIAKIENATYGQVSGFVNNLQSLSNADDSDADEEALRIAQDNMRILLTNALVTTYTYDPLIGITSITDPKGLRVYYHYDEFGRLKNVTDHDGNILSENQYHYKN